MDQKLGVELLDQLIKGCIKADRQSQSRLYSRFAPGMMVVCLRYAKTREEAEEMLQEGFLQVFQKIAQFRGEGSFEGWVRKIMVNAALQKLRSKPFLSPVISLEAIPKEPIGSDMPFELLSAKELIALIQELPPMYRAVFNLHAFEGMKHREIAEALGISEGTSKSNLSDARVLLRRALQRQQIVAKPSNF